MTQKSCQRDTIKSLENEIDKYNLRKKEFEDDVDIILESFVAANNDLNQLVCWNCLLKYIVFLKT